LESALRSVVQFSILSSWVLHAYVCTFYDLIGIDLDEQTRFLVDMEMDMDMNIV